MRLVGGLHSAEGRVEVQIAGLWGTICDDGWDATAADVICRQLGYESASEACRQGAHFGRGSGLILLDDVSCTGDESNINQCSHSLPGIHDCSHAQDAKVTCYTGDFQDDYI